MGLLIVLVAIAGAVPAARGGMPITDLDNPPSWLPYRAHPAFDLQLPPLELVSVLPPEADSTQTVVWPSVSSLRAHRWRTDYPTVIWEERVPGEFAVPSQSDKCARAIAFDGGTLAPDGSQELGVLAESADGSRHELWLLDRRSGRFRSRFDLPQGQDTNGDGLWDGRYGFVGTVDCAAAVGGRALVLVCNVRYDLGPRGIRAVDPADGRTLWLHETGVAFDDEHFRGEVVDLDGDGGAEIVVQGWAPDNLHGVEVNGTSDDRCWLIVLDAGGRLRWRRAFGGPYALARSKTSDLDGDGVLEIVSCTQWKQEPDSNRVIVWSAAGEVRAQLVLGTPLLGLAFLPSRPGPGGDIVVGAANGQMLRLRLAGDRLETVAEVVSHRRLVVQGSLDCLPTPGPELVVSVGAGGVFILSQDLQPLAHSLPPGYDSVLPASTWRLSPRESVLLLRAGIGGALRFEPVPRPRPVAPLVAGAVGLAICAGAVAWRQVRRRVHEAALAPLAGAALRQGRLDLLGRLELEGHGRIGALKALRDLPGRMNWHLEASAAAGDEGGAEVAARIVARVRPACTDYLEVTVPELMDMLVLARRCGADGTLVARAGEALEATRLLVSRLLERGQEAPGLTSVLPELTEYAAEVGLLFERLRRWLEAGFRADVGLVVSRVVQAHEAAAREGGVEVVAQAGVGLTARIEDEELAFVLDNLIDNGLRAMSDAATRRLVIDTRVVAEQVIIEVRDTGHGIPPGDREKLMETRFSTRGDGGGIGLVRSRRLLRKYNATIELLDSVPGRGTTFQVRVPGVRTPSLEEASRQQ